MFHDEDQWFDYWAAELDDYFFYDWCAITD